MGCGASSTVNPEGDTAASAASAAVEEELLKQHKEENAIVKLLVLGTGESGKSTVFKQMKILYSVPDPPSKFIAVCRANLFGNARTVAEGLDKLGIKYADSGAEEAASRLLKVSPDGNDEITSTMLGDFEAMYADAGVQEAIERAAEYQLNDSTRYFWERAKEILAPSYMPSEQDVLRARVRTTGIVQQNFQIKDRKYTMFDVGGQRNERRKWIHCFDNVTAVIFVTAISEYDQVLFEDENTNRMDEAVTLFDQICNHNSFKSTSMILFLNKRDLFQEKLKKKDLTCWDPKCDAGHDYDKAIAFIKQKFLDKNSDPLVRQVYCHATCATDTSNVAFVMDSVFDVILKDNLRKMQRADLSKILDAGGGTGHSTVKTGPTVWSSGGDKGKIVLAALFYTEDLSSRQVMVCDGAISDLPAVEMCPGKLTQDSEEFNWIMSLGKEVPEMVCPPGERGSIKGSFKEAVKKLYEMLGTKDLGFVYDTPVYLQPSGITLLLCVRKMGNPKLDTPPGLGFKPAWVVHEEFLNAHFPKYDNRMATPVAAPDKGEEFDPFAANPTGFNWFKGVTLFTKNVSAIPDKGVYLGVFKVLSAADGFKVMVNEHNRIMIPIIFISESQLEEKEITWMHGVRVRESKGIDLLEGGKPNRGWLGPEMSGEEGATFPEKLWWACDEAKARLDISEKDKLGEFYDYEVMDVDEQSNLQLIMYASLAKGEDDLLPGHVWVDRSFLEVQNMKYYCPSTLQALLKEQNGLVNDFLQLDQGSTLDAAGAAEMRKKKDALKEKLDKQIMMQMPLKWVNRVIMWVADKMASFAAKIDGQEGLDPDTIVQKAMAMNAETKALQQARRALLTKYKS